MICQNGFGFFDTQNICVIRYVLPNGIKCNARFLTELARTGIMPRITQHIRSREIIVLPVCNSKVDKYRKTHEENKVDILWINN